jgi:hypothetical protein
VALHSHRTLHKETLNLNPDLYVLCVTLLLPGHMFLGLPDPDPLVIGMDPDPALDPDPDPSIIMQK